MWMVYVYAIWNTNSIEAFETNTKKNRSFNAKITPTHSLELIKKVDTNHVLDGENVRLKKLKCMEDAHELITLRKGLHDIIVKWLELILKNMDGAYFASSQVGQLSMGTLGIEAWDTMGLVHILYSIIQN